MKWRLSLLLLMCPSLFGFDYFKQGINYFKKKDDPPKKTAIKPEPEKTPLPTPPSSSPDSEKISWSTILDPNKDEIYKEGNSTPPAAFIKAARDPSDENIRNWFKYNELKSQLASRMQTRIEEYLKKNSSMPVESQFALTQAKQELPPPSVPEHTRYRFRLYVDSKCPHCKRMLGTMETLQKQGFFVELRQVDNGSMANLAPTLPVIKASQEEISKKDISSVPVLFAADLKKQVVYRIAGYQTPNAVFGALNSQSPLK